MANQNEFQADVIEVTVNGTFKTEHVFRTADSVLGLLKLNGMISKGTFQGADGSQQDLKRTKFWRSEFQLSEGGRVLASALAPKAFRRAYEIDYQGQALQLKPGGSKFRSWTALAPDGSPVCEIKPRGAFKRGALIQLFAPVALSLLAFLYTLVSSRWQEENTVAAT